MCSCIRHAYIWHISFRKEIVSTNIRMRSSLNSLLVVFLHSGACYWWFTFNSLSDDMSNSPPLKTGDFTTSLDQTARAYIGFFLPK